MPGDYKSLGIPKAPTTWSQTTLLRRVATCWVLKIELVRMPGRNFVARTWPNDNSTMQHPQMLDKKLDHFQIWANNTQQVSTCRNTFATGCGQMRTICRDQQYCDVLHRNIAIDWPGLKAADNHECPLPKPRKCPPPKKPPSPPTGKKRSILYLTLRILSENNLRPPIMFPLC